MVSIAYDEIYVHPLKDGHRFPMLKYELIPAQLLHEGIISAANLFSPGQLDEDILLLSHHPEYWKSLKDYTLTEKEQRRIGFPLTPRLLERELRIAKGTVDGALHAKDHKLAFNVAGGTHHAGSNWGEGFCLLNDQAIAANYLIKNKIFNRILIIDLDVHQGNGTAEILAGNSNVFTFSMHAEKNFPFRKETSDLDIGLAQGTQDDEYLNILKNVLPDLFKRHQPDFIFYLAGVDVLATDKLGHLSLTKAGCKERDRMVFQFCADYSLPVQVSMGGGYSPEIRDIVDAHCNTYKVGIDILAD
ncbi:histone deacetylase [Pedobacter sp. MC2016-14]|uniref:histone deacetylase family protein n=1 Tax=Pedobacter sp. MC2016-14 TaxID=2897327 RepID=UPI001E4A1093|nr:histone deacetylase [Pedobacter sp. MC2016-14]MCD0490159.1 histone deacetylase [Pedobacter sp. MC2016-14]